MVNANPDQVRELLATRPLDDLSDEELVTAHLDGRPGAFQDLYDRYRDRLVHFITRKTGDPDRAQDLVQEAFIRAHRALGSLSDPIAFPAWFGRIVHNEAITWLRRNRRRHQVAIEDEGRLVAPEDSGPDLAAEERGHRLRQALDKLRPAYRQILALKYEARLSYEEIAEVLDLPLGTVKARIHRARAMMKDKLQRRRGGLGSVLG